jgi:hypothetical protein
MSFYNSEDVCYPYKVIYARAILMEKNIPNKKLPFFAQFCWLEPCYTGTGVLNYYCFSSKGAGTHRKVYETGSFH